MAVAPEVPMPTPGADHTFRPMAQLALEAYGVSGARITFLKEGKQPAFRVRIPGGKQRRVQSARYVDGNYLLRVFPEGTRTPAVTRSELRWLRGILSGTQLVVPEPVPTKRGEHVFEFVPPGDGQRYHAALTRWVRGRFFLRPHGPGPRAMHLVGRAMAQLHQHGQTYARGRQFRCPRWNFAELFGEHSAYPPGSERGVLSPEECQLFARVVRRCRDAMEQLGEGPNVFGLVHGDLIQLNYLFHQGEVRVVDFGDFGFGHYVFDAAVTLFALLGLDSDGAQRRAFIAGYRDIRPFPGEYEKLLDLFLAARGVQLSRSVIAAMGDQVQDRRTPYIDRVVDGIRNWVGAR